MPSTKDICYHAALTLRCYFLFGIKTVISSFTLLLAGAANRINVAPAEQKSRLGAKESLPARNSPIGFFRRFFSVFALPRRREPLHFCSA